MIFLFLDSFSFALFFFCDFNLLASVKISFFSTTTVWFQYTIDSTVHVLAIPVGGQFLEHPS